MCTAGCSVKEAEEVVGALQGFPFSNEQGAPGAGERALLPVELSVEILEGLLRVGAPAVSSDVP